MAIPSSIVPAAAAFALNANLLEKNFKDISEEQWVTLPGGAQNHLMWVTGHIVWARSSTIRFLGATWTRPWLKQFARGTTMLAPSEYPALSELIDAWADSSASLAAAFENASEEKMAEPLPPPPNQLPPSLDGKMSGVLLFMSHHEWYHVGQARFIKRCLGCA